MRVLVRDLKAHVGQEVELLGFLHWRRDLGRIQFLLLRDRSGVVQVVTGGLKLPLPESALRVRGLVVENAKRLAEALARRGYRIVTGGTDNHLFLVDLRPKGLTGKEAEERLDAVGITVNKNAIPFDPKPPRVTSGIRIGTPAITTRGFTPEEMPLVAELIDRALLEGPSEALREEVRRLALAHPMP
mgnify:CR=1 FL=1